MAKKKQTPPPRRGSAKDKPKKGAKPNHPELRGRVTPGPIQRAMGTGKPC